MSQRPRIIPKEKELVGQDYHILDFAKFLCYESLQSLENGDTTQEPPFPQVSLIPFLQRLISIIPPFLLRITQ